MLMLSRRIGESIQIGPDIEIRIVKFKRRAIKLGVIAPRDMPVRFPPGNKTNNQPRTNTQDESQT